MQARKKNKFNVLWKILYILNQEIWRDTSRQFMKEEVIEKKCNSFFWKFLYSIRILGDAQTWFLCKKLYLLLQDIWHSCGKSFTTSGCMSRILTISLTMSRNIISITYQCSTNWEICKKSIFESKDIKNSVFTKLPPLHNSKSVLQPWKFIIRKKLLMQKCRATFPPDFSTTRFKKIRGKSLVFHTYSSFFVVVCYFNF